MEKQENNSTDPFFQSVDAENDSKSYSGKRKILLYSSLNKKIELIKEGDKVIDATFNGSSIHEKVNAKRDILEDAHERKVQNYIGYLKTNPENLLFLLGAGASMSVGGKSMGQLWDVVVEKMGEELLKELKEKFRYKSEEKDLELLLTRLSVALDYNPEEKVEKTEVLEIKKQIESIIKEECSFSLPENAPHLEFLRRITTRSSTHNRVKIFTTNYDRTIEQSASNVGTIIIDGFSFTGPREFSGRYYDFDIVLRKSREKEENSFIQSVIHLYKLHGSVTWEKEEDSIYSKPDIADMPLMIYPHREKYEASFDQPYFEMMSRFQESLRKKNTLLVTIGYSFKDKHISNAIYEAYKQNPGFQLLVVDPGIESESFKKLRVWSETSPKVAVVNERFEEFVNSYPFEKKNILG